MTDKVYLKQLEKFGTESTVFVEGDLAKRQQLEFTEANIDVVKAIMNTIEGRQWLYSKLDMCRVFTSPFVAGDPHGTSFFAGIQSVGQNLLDDIMKASPNNFFLMISEAAARKQNQKSD